MSHLKCGAMLCLLAGALGPQLLAQSGGAISAVKVEGKEPGVAVSAGVMAGGTLYVSGQGGLNADGSVPKNFAQEVSQSLSNVQGVLRASGMDFGNVVWMNVYVSHAADVAGMNDVYRKTIGSSPPARTVVVVGALPHSENISINCIAVQDTATRRAVWPTGWQHGPQADPPAIMAKDVLYMSAQGGVDPLTGKLAADFSGEVKQALDNVATVLKAANMTMANVVFVNPFLTADSAQGPMNRTYATYFESGNTPGRATIGFAGLPGNLHIVFTCIAGADLAKRKAVRPKNMAPSPTASPGVLYGDTFYLSAKSGFIPDQGIVTPDVELQLRQTMRNLLDGLQETDLDFPDVVFATVYLKHIEDADKVKALYGTFFKKGFPARTTLQQSFDVKTTTEEQISFIAVRQGKP